MEVKKYNAELVKSVCLEEVRVHVDGRPVVADLGFSLSEQRRDARFGLADFHPLR